MASSRIEIEMASLMEAIQDVRGPERRNLVRKALRLERSLNDIPVASVYKGPGTVGESSKGGWGTTIRNTLIGTAVGAAVLPFVPSLATTGYNFFTGDYPTWAKLALGGGLATGATVLGSTIAGGGREDRDY